MSIEGLELIKAAEGLYKKAREKYEAGDLKGALIDTEESVGIQKKIAEISSMPFFGSDSEFLRQEILEKLRSRSEDSSDDSREKK